MLVTAVAATIPGTSRALPQHRQRESKFDRIMQRHDRKGELRAAVLGIDASEFRELVRHTSLEVLIHRYGFKNVRSFRLALLGKIKDELHGRGWSKKRIEKYVVARSNRM